MATLDGPAGEKVQSILADCASLLTQQGVCEFGSGRLRWAKGAIAIHTDFGPVEQDKETNQDFVLAWVGDERGERPTIQWALAMADGVTASYCAELGAELACRAGLARILAYEGTPRDKARAAVNAAGDAIGAVADVIEEDAEHYRPEDMFASTWRYTLREGLLLQTTLTLAWLEDEACHLAIVGDGGAAVEFWRGPQHEQKVLAAPNAETSRVHAIGPKNRHVEQLDCWKQVVTKDLSLLAVYTDGVAHGISPEASLLFEQLQEDRSESDTDNVAEQLIRGWISKRADEFEDNLSLAIASWE